MTSIIQAIILGIIQGITEWLPISSSGHLVITKYLFNIQPDILFDVLLHYGSLIVILTVFYKDIAKIVYSFIPQSFFKRKYKTFKQHNYYKQYQKLAYYIIIASVPTAMIGFYFHDLFEYLFSDIFAVSIALLVTGLILYSTKFKTQYPITRKYTIINTKQNKTTKQHNYNPYQNNTLKSLTIGIAQGLAIIPGISRSGSTISTGLLLGLDKKKAATFSFLLAIPAIFGATLYEIHTAPTYLFNTEYLIPILVGTIFSIITGFLSLKWLLKIINKGHIHRFAYYCWAVGIMILIVSL